MGNSSRFVGRTALITGGASGIGLAIGTELTRLGAAVTLADVDGDALTAAVDRLGAPAPGVAANAIELDVTDREAFVRVVDELVDRAGGLDLLVRYARSGGRIVRRPR